ncbi:MAG: hypothetical protein HKN48_05885 [Flavobacteriaceae bacterium]|nr:hypothetical protein [Flavobacteriaceae bacterium]
MKVIAKSFQKLALFLAFLLMLQGCTVYKGSITLEEAVQLQKKVKVTTSENEKPYEFAYIEDRNGDYVGLPARYKQYGEVELQKDKITEIKEHDKTMSTIITFTPIAIIVALGVVLFTNESEN